MIKHGKINSVSSSSVAVSAVRYDAPSHGQYRRHRARMEGFAPQQRGGHMGRLGPTAHMRRHSMAGRLMHKTHASSTSEYQTSLISLHSHLNNI